MHPKSCPTVVAPLTTKSRDIREFRIQEKSVFSVPSVGVETSDNNKRIANNSLLPYALYDGGGVVCKSYNTIQ